MEIRGPNLLLRYPRDDDAAGLFALGSDPEVTRYFSWGPYREEAEARAWLATLPERRAEGIALELAIADAGDDLLGIILLSELSARDRRAIVGTWLGRASWGTGVNAEAKALIAALAFGPLGLRRLGAYADLRNARSRAALAKLGFEEEGVLRAFHRHGGEPRDVVIASLLHEDWEDGPLAAIDCSISGEPPAVFTM